jgi:hypothetical protein
MGETDGKRPHRRSRTRASRGWNRAATLSVIAALAVSAVAGLSACTPATSSSAPSSADRAQSAAQTLIGSLSSGVAELDADLAKAIQTADASASPQALDAHIRKATGAPSSMIVAPYDPRAEADSPEFDRSQVAGAGTDAAFTTEFEGYIHDSQGTALRGISGWEGLNFFAGRPIKVGGRPGFVLIAKPVPDSVAGRSSTFVEPGFLYRNPLPASLVTLDTQGIDSPLLSAAGYTSNGDTLTVYVDLASWNKRATGRFVLVVP